MRCVLHIGPPKTGTTSIQHFLTSNRKLLSDCGVLVPRARLQRHSELTLLGLEKVKRNSRAFIPWNIRSDEDLRRVQDEIEKELAEQIEAARQSHHSVVMSAEGLAGLKPPGVRRLHRTLSAAAGSFRVVLYLRRQDLLETSRYKNNLLVKGRRGGGPFGGRSANYLRILNTWSEVFGEAALHPVIFPDSTPQPRELIESFVEAAGLEGVDLDACRLPGRRNEAIDARALELLARVNAQLPAVRDGAVPGERRVIESVLIKGWPDRVRYRPPRAEAEAFYARFRANNERVRQRWFPAQPTLFHEDFSMYPESSEASLSVDDCVHVMLELARYGTDDETGAALRAAAARKNRRGQRKKTHRTARGLLGAVWAALTRGVVSNRS